MPIRRALKLTSSAIGLGLGLCAACPALAQAAGEEENAGLEEIVVTAQRRSESLQRAGIAVTAVSAESLERAAITDATQLTTLAPALQINTIYGPTANFYIRGVGNFVTNSSSDPAVIVNLDGVPLGRPSGVHALFYDLERVEVLKGPQGTLYGRNATGGAINVLSAQPRPGELSGHFTASYGNYDAININGAINVPVGERGALRVAAMLSKRDGTYSDGSGDEDVRAVRFAMGAELTETLKMVVSLDYAEMGGKGAGTTVSGLDRDDRIGLSDPRAGALFASSFAFLHGQNLQAPDVKIFQNNKFWGVRMQADLETTIGTLSLIPAYRRNQIDMLSSSALEARTVETNDQASVEMRLVSSSTEKLQYIFGAFYYNDDNHSLTNYNFQYFAPLSSIEPTTRSYAGYGRLTYSITPELRISLGARYTIDKRGNRFEELNQLVICPGAFRVPPYSVGGVPFTGGFCVGAPRLPVQLTPITDYPQVNPGGAFFSSALKSIVSKRTFKKATWRAGLEYDAGDDSLLYASVETGYKSGGFFASTDPNDSSYEPESIVAYTLGSKNRFLNDRLQLNLEAFWWDYKDQQVSLFLSVNNSLVFGTRNVGRSRLRGVELDLRAQVMDNTEVYGTVQYLDARNTTYVYQTSASAGLPITGCAVTGPTAGDYTVDCSGTRPSNAPKWVLMGGIKQHIALGDAGKLWFYANTRYQSTINTGTELLAAQNQKGYFISDAQLVYTTSDDKISIGVYINNIEDNNAVGFSQTHPRATELLVESLRMPRTYGVRAGVKF